MEYSPIARNFFRLRRLLMDSLGLPREAIRPSIALADLVPPEERQRIWPLLEREGVYTPFLTLPPDLKSKVMLLVLAWASVVALASKSVFAFLIALVDGSYLAYRWSRPWATDVRPETMTLGDVAICITTLEECRRSGYHFSERDIFVKLRLILWQTSQIPYEKITPQTRFIELGE
jgi:hypothetical protein